MEALIAALVGWIDTEDAILDLRTGLQITNTTEDEKTPKCEVTYPNGDTTEFEGPDAAAIMDRGAALAAAGGALIIQLNHLTAGTVEGAQAE